MEGKTFKFWFKHSVMFDENVSIKLLENYTKGEKYIGYFYVRKFERLVYSYFVLGLPIKTKLTATQGYKFAGYDYERIAACLGMTVEETESFIKRLIEVELITNDGHFSDEIGIFFGKEYTKAKSSDSWMYWQTMGVLVTKKSHKVVFKASGNKTGKLIIRDYSKMTPSQIDAAKKFAEKMMVSQSFENYSADIDESDL